MYGTSSPPLKPEVEVEVRTRVIPTKAMNAGSTRKELTPTSKPTEEDNLRTRVIPTKAMNAGSKRKELTPTSKPTEPGSLICFLLHS